MIGVNSELMNIKKAAIINAIGKYSKIFLSLIVNAILARIISANDYGIVAVITVFSTFFTTFSDMGFGAAIIQKKDLSKDDIDNIFSFTVFVSIALMLAFAFFSFPIAYFYNDSVYIHLGIILSVSLLFNALNMVPNGILNRDKRFVSIAFRTVVVYICSAIVAVILALCGFSYYALAIQAVLSALFTFIWNVISTQPKFIVKFSMESIKKVFNYSGFQFAFNVVNYFSRNLDNLLTGKFMGNVELGYYNKAYSLMLYPVNNLTGVISPVLHPILSDYQKELDVIYQKYVKLVKMLMCIGIFVSAYCYLGAKEIIDILYGANWNESIDCFRFLSIAIVPQMINSSAGAIFQAIGNTKLLFINSCINTGITIVAILIGVFLGNSITILSICVAIAYICHFVTAFYMLIKMGFNFSSIAFFKSLYKEFIILLILGGSVLVYPVSINNIFVSAAIKMIYVAILFSFMMVITKEHKMFLAFFKKGK